MFLILTIRNFDKICLNLKLIVSIHSSNVTSGNFENKSNLIYDAPPFLRNRISPINLLLIFVNK